MKKHPFVGKLVMIAAVSVASLVGVLWILRSLDMIHAFRVPTAAMSPFLSLGDHIYVESLSPSSRVIKRGDVRCFTTKGIKGINLPEGQTQVYIKRVVGLPGDELVIRERQLWINGKPQSEVFTSPVMEYLDTGASGVANLDVPYVVPPDQYFVIGDNTGRSSDSRFWGAVPRQNFTHLYWMHYWHAAPVAEERH
jgi:signal peptidase I